MQMRRSAVSIPSNIVEGCARESNSEYLRSLEIAFASLKELHYQYTLACRLGYADKSEITGHELHFYRNRKSVKRIDQIITEEKKPKSLIP